MWSGSRRSKVSLRLARNFGQPLTIKILWSAFRSAILCIQPQLVWAECVGCPWTLSWYEVTIIFGIICHNLGQPKAKSPRLVLYSHTHWGSLHLSSTRQTRGWSWLCRWNKKDDQHMYWKWKTTLIFWMWNGTIIFSKRKDDLNRLTNERWLKVFGYQRRPQFSRPTFY